METGENPMESVMRSIFAVAVGLVVWFATFAIFEFLGFWLWDMQPNHIPTELVVGFLASLIAILLAEQIMKTVDAKLKVRWAMLALGLLVGGFYTSMFFFGPAPDSGYAPLLAGLGASLVPFVILFIKADA